MDRRVAVAFLVALFVGATSPVWAAPLGGNPTFVPDPASPGATISFAGTIPDGGAAGPCEVVQTDGTPPDYDCSYDASAMSGWVVVPTSATPGVPYLLDFCGPVNCFTEGGKTAWALTNGVGVVAPPHLVVVPDLWCQPYAAASSLLAEDDLTPFKPTFPPVVGGQSPTAGATVAAPRGVALRPLLVPGLTGMTFPPAAVFGEQSTVLRSCASFVAVGGSAGVVVSQAPSAGVPLPAGRRITLYFSPSPSSSAIGSSFSSTSQPTSRPPYTKTVTSVSSSVSTPTSTSQGSGHDPVAKKVGRWVRHRVPQSLPLAALAGIALVGAREWRVFHRPVVDPAACVVRVGTPFPTTAVTYDEAGAARASYVVVRHDHRPTVEEAP